MCEKLIDKNVESIALTTKEPLLNNENLEVIKKLSEVNVRVLLVTNATLIGFWPCQPNCNVWF